MSDNRFVDEIVERIGDVEQAVKALHAEADEGMSMRDRFACAALQGLIASSYTDDQTLKDIVDGAYTYADLMLARRADGGAK